MTTRLKAGQVDECSQNVVKKRGSENVFNRPKDPSKMLPQFYHAILASQLTAAQYLTLQMLVMLVQTYKNIQIEKLAENLALPAKYESRRRHIQRWLSLKILTLSGIWHPIIREIIKRNWSAATRLELIIDRTQWGERNIFMVSVRKGKRSLPISWTILNKKGASNLQEQKELLTPVFVLLQEYNIIVIGDREFHSAKLGEWLKKRKVSFILRQRKNTNIREKNGEYHSLKEQLIIPGKRSILRDVEVTLESPSNYNIVIYSQRAYGERKEQEVWYLLTDLCDAKEVVKLYERRWGIEAMFKDYKTGGYHIEDAKMKPERLEKMLIVIAIAYTIAVEKGEKIKASPHKCYVERQRTIKQKPTKNSNFWVGMYGENWARCGTEMEKWAEKLGQINPNKRRFYQRGLKAKQYILSIS